MSRTIYQNNKFISSVLMSSVTIYLLFNLQGCGEESQCQPVFNAKIINTLTEEVTLNVYTGNETIFSAPAESNNEYTLIPKTNDSCNNGLPTYFLYFHGDTASTYRVCQKQLSTDKTNNIYEYTIYEKDSICPEGSTNALTYGIRNL